MTRNEFFVFIAIAGTTVALVQGMFDLYVRYFDHGLDRWTPQAPAAQPAVRSTSPAPVTAPLDYRAFELKPRLPIDTSGFSLLAPAIPPWEPDASLQKIAESWKRPGLAAIAKLDEYIDATRKESTPATAIRMTLIRAALFDSEGMAKQAYETLEQTRRVVERDRSLTREFLYSVIYFQGVASMRRGENENCVDCRGESSCILPISDAAVHKNPTGSRMAIRHFTEYLDRFPDDLEARWLLNLAHMTLGEHPSKVDPQFLISLDRFRYSEFDIGRFREIGHLTGVNRFNQAGGAIMEDFDNDGRLDLAVSSIDPTEPLSVYRNTGDGTFEDRSEPAGVKDQLGGLFCVQTDYNNDGFMDVYTPRGAWLSIPMRPSLLRNNGNGTFTDVTKDAGLLDPVNSNSACWADYDNDGWLDLFVCCERQFNRLYHNRRDGTFEEVSASARLRNDALRGCKGANWVDFDNDDYPDLFLNNLNGAGQLYHNDRDGTFSNVTSLMGIDGPIGGFSCWAWDYDNDGWLDLFATSYDRTVRDVVKGLIGQPHERHPNKLFRNINGKGFVDLTKQAGLDLVFATMGSNFADFDGDGFLDIYLATGDPNFATLVPNRMFKNVAGQRFAEITGTSGTGHLQKGHGVACGDWDRDGDIDLFVQTGGAVNGDKFHNLHFQNPGQGNHWLTLKLVGKKTNRAAIGARIKVVTAGDAPITIYRHVSSGSSFGANPLEQTIGIARSEQVARLEIHWPSSGTTQVFHNVRADQSLEITEFAPSYRPLERNVIPAPE